MEMTAIIYTWAITKIASLCLSAHVPYLCAHAPCLAHVSCIHRRIRPSIGLLV